MESNAEILMKEIKEQSSSLWKSERDAAGGINKIGCALNTLKKEKLYKKIPDCKGNPYASWMSFVKNEFDFTPQYANRLMKNAKTQQKLEDNGLTTAKQPDAILYMIRNVEDFTALWLKVTNGDKTMIPTRSLVQEAVGKPNRREKVSKRMSVQEILKAISAYLAYDDKGEKEDLLKALHSLLDNNEEEKMAQ